MLLTCVNLDQLHHLVHRMRALCFELAIPQKEILTLEFDHRTLVEAGSEDDNVCSTIEFQSVWRLASLLSKQERRRACLRAILKYI